MTWQQHAIAALVIVLAVCLEFGEHVRTAEFVYEDQRIVDGIALGTDQPIGLGMVFAGRGITAASWQAIRTPQAAHLLNVVLHLGVVLLIALLIGRLAGPVLGWSTAAIFALHPLAIEGVAYAASRAELLAGMGVLGACLASTYRSVWAWLLVVACAVLAYAGKETGIAVLLLVPAVLWVQGRLRWSLWLDAGLGVLAASLVQPRFWAWVTSWAGIGEHAGQRVDALAWIGIQAAAVYRLIVLSVAPFWMTPDPDLYYVTIAGQLFALIAIAGLLEIAWRLRRREPMLAFGIVVLLGAAVLRFVVRTPTSPFNEHQWYLPLVGASVCLAVGVRWLAAQMTSWLTSWRLRKQEWTLCR